MTDTRDRAAGVQLVAAYVRERAGLSTTGPREPQVLAAIAMAMSRAGARSGDEYRRLLQRDPRTFEDLAAQLTIGESYFFRDSNQLELVRTQILPERAAARPPGEDLRLWSAGCAGGQEAYTLAILLEEVGLGSRARILATDLSPHALTLAQAGVFREWSLRDVGDDHRRRWFHPVRGGFRVDQSLGRLITFRQDNLVDPDGNDESSDMDVILCRNVLIYLTPEAVDQAARRLASSLAPGGWLLTGPSDPALRVDGLDATVTPAGIVYRRQLGRGPTTPSGRRLLGVAPVATGFPPTGPPTRVAQPPKKQEQAPASPARDESETASSEVANAEAASVEAARHALERADYSAAERIARGVMQQEEHGSEPAAVLIRSLAGSGHLTAALEAATGAIAAFPVDAELRALQTLVLLDDGRSEDAAAAARAAVYLDPSLAVAHIALAQAEASRANFAAARRSLRNAAALLEAMQADTPVPLAEGDTAGGLAGVVAAQERSLEAASNENLERL